MMENIPMKSFFIALITALLCTTGVSAAEEETGAAPTTGREATVPGRPGFARVSDNDPQMDRAVENAQKTLAFFMAAVRAKKNGDTAFEIKKGFVDGDKVEHLWIKVASFDGKNFHGKIDNQPIDVNNAHSGQRVTVAPPDVDDWMFLKDGKLIGAYTTRVLYARLSPEEKAQYDKQAEFKIQ
jgi:uncharacterized protein YegJ (DUF2314 family)